MARESPFAVQRWRYEPNWTPLNRLAKSADPGIGGRAATPAQVLAPNLTGLIRTFSENWGAILLCQTAGTQIPAGKSTATGKTA